MCQYSALWSFKIGCNFYITCKAPTLTFYLNFSALFPVPPIAFHTDSERQGSVIGESNHTRPSFVPCQRMIDAHGLDRLTSVSDLCRASVGHDSSTLAHLEEVYFNTVRTFITLRNDLFAM